MTMNILPLDATAGAPAFTAQQTRQALSALFGVAPTGRPLGATSGVRPGTPSSTVFLSGAGSTTWNVAAHSGVLDTQTSALAGPYSYSTDGSDTGAITAADATNPRVDIVYVKVNDNVQDGSGLTSGVVGYLAGSPAASPSAPATPARAMVLATIAVPKVGAGAPTVSWVAPIAGGPQASDSTIVLGGLRVQWGLATNSAGPGVNVDSPAIVFPVAFSATPRLWVGPAATTPGSGHTISAQPLTCTATQFTFRTRWSDDASHGGQPVQWLAIGPA